MNIKSLCVMLAAGMVCLPLTGFGDNFAELKQKAEQGDVEAQYKFGGCYYEGLVVAQDYQEAVKWYLLAADQAGKVFAKIHAVYSF